MELGNHQYRICKINNIEILGKEYMPGTVFIFTDIKPTVSIRTYKPTYGIMKPEIRLWTYLDNFLEDRKQTYLEHLRFELKLISDPYPRFFNDYIKADVESELPEYNLEPIFEVFYRRYTLLGKNTIVTSTFNPPKVFNVAEGDRVDYYFNKPSRLLNYDQDYEYIRDYCGLAKKKEAEEFVKVWNSYFLNEEIPKSKNHDRVRIRYCN